MNDVMNDLMNNLLRILWCLFLLVIAIIAEFLLLKFGWSWVIPDFFPNAVAQGLIVGSLSNSLTAKIITLIFIGGGISAALRFLSGTTD